jgi:exopolysaccharide production protein ExoZ
MPIKNFKSLQILRFVAATSVVYAHIFANPNFGTFGVDIFFVLSGFVIALVISSNPNPYAFAINRINRITPLYWLLTSLLMVVITFKPELVSTSTASSANVANFAKSLFFIPYEGSIGIVPILTQGWTLNYEMFFYLCVSISLLIAKSHALKITFVLITFAYFLFGNLLLNKVANNFFGSEIIFEFILGFFAYQLYTKNFLNLLSDKFYIFAAIAIYIYMAFIESNGVEGNRFIKFGLPSFALVICSVKLEPVFQNSQTYTTRILVSMGDASYATYLTHWYVLVALRKLLSEKLELFDFYSPLGIFFGLSTALVVGQITYKFGDKPLNKLLKNLFNSRINKPLQ